MVCVLTWLILQILQQHSLNRSQHRLKSDNMTIKMYLGMIGALLMTWAAGLLMERYVSDPLFIALIGFIVLFAWFGIVLYLTQQIEKEHDNVV